MNGSRTTCEPAAMIACAKRTTFFAPVFACAGPSVSSTSTMVRIEELADAADDLDLARLGHAGEPAGQLADDLVLPAAQLGEVDLRRAERDAVRRPASSLSSITAAMCSSAFDGMQPTLRHTPPSAGVALDQHRLHAEVRGAERGAVAARAGAEHQHLALDVDLAGVGRGSPGSAAARGRRGVAARRMPAAAPAPRPLPPVASRRRPPASSTTISEPSLTLSPSLTCTSLTVPPAGAGTSIVALSDSSVTSESSAFTTSPGLTKISMTGMSLKSPMSGTLIRSRSARHSITRRMSASSAREVAR